MFREEGTYDHPTAIVHVAGVIKLAHSGIDDWVAGFAFAPCFEMFLIVLPFDICVFGLEGLVHAKSCQSQGSAEKKKRTYQT